MEKIRVINVISDSNIGGAGNMLLSFMRLTDRDVFEHLVVVPRNALLLPELERMGIAAVTLPGLAEKSLDWGSVEQLRKLFKQWKPDIVHTHASMSARIAARLYGKCKVVYTRHSVFDQPPADKSFPRKQLKGFINNSLADTIIAVSPAAGENLTETGTSPDKIQVVFNGVDPVPVLSPAEKGQVLQSYGLSPADFVCAVIARLEAVKGHEYILEAAAMLRNYADIKILIAGTGGMEQALCQKAHDMRLTDTCIFTGFIKDIGRLENIMDLQLNASYGTEATSLSLLEGMSLGIPAVVSDFGGNPYVIRHGENGLVVPKRNAGALAEGILRLHQNPAEYEAMRRRAREIYAERFTSGAMVAQVEEIYKRLAAGQPERKR